MGIGVNRTTVDKHTLEWVMFRVRGIMADKMGSDWEPLEDMPHWGMCRADIVGDDLLDYMMKLFLSLDQEERAERIAAEDAKSTPEPVA